MKRASLRILLGAAAFALFFAGQAAANTIETVAIEELSTDNGITFTVTNGGAFPCCAPGEIQLPAASLSITLPPSITNINIYDDAAHTSVSDTLVAQVNPASGQLFLNFVSDPLAALTPQNVAITEDGTLQTVLTLTNNSGDQLVIRVQSQVSTPEPSTWLLLSSGLASLAVLRRRFLHA